jgi:hypothetical protein
LISAPELPVRIEFFRHSPSIVNHTPASPGLLPSAYCFSAFLDICELQVDRGDNKGFVALAFDTTPGYNDTQPFPTAP